jgi:hypothetical protein
MSGNKIILSDNHKRSLSSTLIIVEQHLFEIRDVMDDTNQKCCFEITKDIDSRSIEHNKDVINEALALICSLKEKYCTDKATQSLKRVVNAKKSKIWETLHNSKSRRMKGFGEFPQKIVKEYDNDLDQLISITEKLDL